LPRLTVIVDKDETGKLWDYCCPQKDTTNINDLFRNVSLSIHKHESIEESTPEQAAIDDVDDGVTMEFLTLTDEEITIPTIKK
jgi:hypothetical protein